MMTDYAKQCLRIFPHLSRLFPRPSLLSGFPSPYKVRWNVKMDSWVLQVLSYFGYKRLNFLVAPAKDASENRRRVRLYRFNLLYALEHTEFFKLRVFRPSSNGYLSQNVRSRPLVSMSLGECVGVDSDLADLLFDIHEPCCF